MNFLINFPLKIAKKGEGILVHRPRKLTWQGSDVARRRRGTRDHRRMRRGAEATWHGRGWPTWRIGDTCTRVIYIIIYIGYRTYKPILRTGYFL